MNLHGESRVIPALNRDGDCLSDLVMQMFGTIASAEAMLFSLSRDGDVSVAMAEAPHGTAPRLRGKNLETLWQCFWRAWEFSTMLELTPRRERRRRCATGVWGQSGMVSGRPTSVGMRTPMSSRMR